LNGVNTAAFAAFQPLATRSESHWFLAERANQNVEKFLGDHTPYIVARSLMERVLYGEIGKLRGASVYCCEFQKMPMILPCSDIPRCVIRMNPAGPIINPTIEC
jgi:hypothetical protein